MTLRKAFSNFLTALVPFAPHLAIILAVVLWWAGWITVEAAGVVCLVWGAASWLRLMDHAELLAQSRAIGTAITAIRKDIEGIEGKVSGLRSEIRKTPGHS